MTLPDWFAVMALVTLLFGALSLLIGTIGMVVDMAVDIWRRR